MNFTIPTPENTLAASLCEGERAALQQRLLLILARQASLYAMGDTSLPEEAAQELLASLCYTLGLEEPGRARYLLSCPDWEAELVARRARLTQLTRYGKTLWQTVCRQLPPVTSDAMCDSLKGIGDFFRLYDIRYAAHRVAVPILIDYPLNVPVPESLQGIDYINEWLRRFVRESALLRLYPAAELTALLDAASPDWKALPVTLYEPVAANALGCALLGRAPAPLSITAEERARIAALLEPLPRPEAQARLAEAAQALCRIPALHSPAQATYLTQEARLLYPRIQAALPQQHLDGIFFSFSS